MSTPKLTQVQDKNEIAQAQRAVKQQVGQGMAEQFELANGNSATRAAKDGTIGKG